MVNKCRIGGDLETDLTTSQTVNLHLSLPDRSGELVLASIYKAAGPSAEARDGRRRLVVEPDHGRASVRLPRGADVKRSSASPVR